MTPQTQAALKNAQNAFNEILTIHWGWDGDCGARRIAENGFDEIANILKESEADSVGRGSDSDNASSNPKPVLSASEAGEQWTDRIGSECARALNEAFGFPLKDDEQFDIVAKIIAAEYDVHVSSLRQRLKEGGAWNCSQLELQYALSLEETRILRQRLGEAERKLKELGEKL